MSSMAEARWLGRSNNEQEQPMHDDEVHARLARMQVNRVSRQVEELRERWPKKGAANILEGVLLRKRLQQADEAGEIDDRAE